MRLQSERDLPLRRIDELHVHYKRELKKKDDESSTFNKSYIRLNADWELAKKQLEQCRSLINTQKFRTKHLQDELGEEAEFDAEESPKMCSVRRECESRINQYKDRMAQLQSDMRRNVDRQAELLQKESAMMREKRPTTHKGVP
jgi:predicted  nucleic acid-binding Zn-ribbon protein